MSISLACVPKTKIQLNHCHQNNEINRDTYSIPKLSSDEYLGQAHLNQDWIRLQNISQRYMVTSDCNPFPIKKVLVPSHYQADGKKSKSYPSKMVMLRPI